jgi:hypothetical protein
MSRNINEPQQFPELIREFLDFGVLPLEGALKKKVGSFVHVTDLQLEGCAFCLGMQAKISRNDCSNSSSQLGMIRPCSISRMFDPAAPAPAADD